MRDSQGMLKDDQLLRGPRRAQTLPVRFADEQDTQPHVLDESERPFPKIRFIPQYTPRRSIDEYVHEEEFTADVRQSPETEDWPPFMEWPGASTRTHNANAFITHLGQQQPAYYQDTNGLLIPTYPHNQLNEPIYGPGFSGQPVPGFGGYARRRRHRRFPNDNEYDNDTAFLPSERLHRHYSRNADYHQDGDYESSGSEANSDADESYVYSFNLTRHAGSPSSQGSTLLSHTEKSEGDAVPPGSKDISAFSTLGKVHQVFRSAYTGEGSNGGLHAAQLLTAKEGIEAPQRSSPLFRWV